MKKGQFTWAMVALIGTAAALAGRATAETPATQPTTKPVKAGARHHRLTKPYSDMASLTPQQQDQIAKIHEDALDQTKKIHEKEQDDISALLTPEQQTELNAVTGKEKDERKAATATPKHKRGDPATMPAK